MRPTRFIIRDAESIQYIKDNIETMKYTDIAKKLKCSAKLIHHLCKVNNIENPRSRKRNTKKYPVEDIKQYLRDNPGAQAKDVALLFNCNQRYIYDFIVEIQDEKLKSKCMKMKVFFNNATTVRIKPKSCEDIDELTRLSHLGLIALKQLTGGIWEIDFEGGKKLSL